MYSDNSEESKSEISLGLLSASVQSINKENQGELSAFYWYLEPKEIYESKVSCEFQDTDSEEESFSQSEQTEG